MNRRVGRNLFKKTFRKNSTDPVFDLSQKICPIAVNPYLYPERFKPDTIFSPIHDALYKTFF
jgi:hypothetical protein